MISTTETRVLDCLLSSVSASIKLQNRYFTEDEILECADDEPEFSFRSFKSYLETRTKGWCTECDSSFSLCDHPESNRDQKTVYTIDPFAVASEVMSTLARTGPLEDIEQLDTRQGVYATKATFGEERISFYFFADQEPYRTTDIRPLELEFPVLLRGLDSPIRDKYVFGWQELLGDRFRKRLSKVVTSIRNKTAATFVTYDEQFVNDHRTEIRSAIRDYFNDSGYTSHDEIAEHCPEISDYGISAKEADFVCTKDGEENEKILISHGEARDNGWYAQRFTDSRLASVEDEPVYRDLRDQLEDKITYYKRVSKQLNSSSRMMRGVGAIAAFVTAFLTIANLGVVSGVVRDLLPWDVPAGGLTIILLGVNTLLAVVLFYMLVSPFVRERAFSWKLKPVGFEKSRWQITQHRE